MDFSPFDLTHQNNSTESKIIASFERISQAFRVLLWNESKEHALTPLQVQVLIFVLFQDPEKCRVSYLANEFNMTRATISDTVKSLAEKDLISKESDLMDTRSYVIQLTDKGKQVARQTALFTKELKTPLDKLSVEEKENLLLSLINIIHHLTKSGVITIQRMCFTCVYYRENHSGARHYCKLLEQKLENSELRVDCQEHVRASR
jgi:DNA-binding MarR family transcriptional regulator